MMRNRKLSLCVISALILVVTCMTATTTTVAQQNNTVQYVYDENGRLRAVISPTGETSVYTYDAAGNIVSVTRQSTPFVSVSGFTPTSGSVGATVTVFGSGFSANTAEDTVTFNGTHANVTSATASQITTSVPSGATTGPITVVTPSGTATSRTAFVVRPLLEITGFDPNIGTPGTPVTLLGNGFDESIQNDVPRFNGFEAAADTASSEQLVTSVPSFATSGHISVTTPQGTAVSNGDFFVPPPGYSVNDVDFTGRLAYGETKTISLTASFKIGLVVFDSTAGQKVSINTSHVTFPATLMYLYAPDGTMLAQTFSGSVVQTLPATGTYTILVTNYYFGEAGSIDLTLSQFTDVRTPIIAGGPAVTVTLTTPGQTAILSFSGTEGQKVSLAFHDVTIPYADVSLMQPDGSYLASTYIAPDPGFSAGFIDTLTLPVTGTYTIVIEPYGQIGSATAVLYNVVDVSGTITVGGSPLLVTTTVPGQNAGISFDGTAGQTLDLNLSAVSFPSLFVSVYNPDGTILVPRRTIGPGGGEQDLQLAALTSGTTGGGDTGDIPMELPVTGTYLILLDPLGPSTGSATLALAVVQDVTATITIGGPPVTITTHVAGQNALVTFSGTANQRVFLAFTDVNIYQNQVSILNPDGSTLVDPININSNGGAIDINNLPATGTYTIFIEPRYDSTGSMTIQASTTGSLTIGGPTVTTAITTAGQNVSYAFDGFEEMLITVSSSTSIPSGSLTIFRPDGSVFLTGSLYGNNSFVLPDTGTYTLTLDPDGNSGVVTIRLRNGGGGSGDTIQMRVRP